jgi:hypothetical protein
MSIKNDEIIITQKFDAILQAESINLPVDYPGKTASPIGGKIIRLRINHAPSKYAEIGGTRRRNFGSIMIQIVLPTGRGKGEMLGYVDAFINGFHKFKSGALRCKAASFQDGVEESGFITGTVDVPYYSDYSLS